MIFGMNKLGGDLYTTAFLVGSIEVVAYLAASKNKLKF